MAIVHPRDKTYKRFVLDPEDIGEPYPTIDGVRLPPGDNTELIREAISAGKTFDITRDIREGAKKIWVTYRVLNADDMAVMRDKVRQLADGEEGDVRSGTQQKDAVRLAVVDWSLKDPPWNENTQSILDTDLADQIYFWVRTKGIPDEQDPESGLPLGRALTMPAASPLEEPGVTRVERRAQRPASSKATSRNTRTSRAATRSRAKPSSSATE